MYDDSFYETSRAGMIQSAEALVPILMRDLDIVSTARVIDVGCGEGHWAQAFASHGCDVIGIDGGWHGDHLLGDRFIPHNLRDPLPEHLFGRFDVAVCLEVAEHLPKRRAESFVKELCRLAPLIVFSAAIPGQGGTGHINEAWPAYWCELFLNSGFYVNGDYRFAIWNDDRIENWYRQNLLVAWDVSQIPSPLPPTTSALPVVHPILYDARRKR